MKYSTVLNIAAKVNEAAASDGVSALVNPNPPPARCQPSAMEVWDIELSYNGYLLVERFNSGMPIDDFDSSRIAMRLLANLFGDYFEVKLKVRPTPSI